MLILWNNELMNDTPPPENDTVADRVLKSFVDAVAETDGLSDVAARLSKNLLKEGNINESSLRQALFNEHGS
jgi:hypothetical protein